MRAGRLDKAEVVLLKKPVCTLILHMWAIAVHTAIHNRASGRAQELEESSGIYPNVTFTWH